MKINRDALSAPEQTQIRNIEQQTGKSLEDWIRIVSTSGLSKHGELVAFLKSDHGFTHGNANMIVHWAKQSHAGAADGDELVETQYAGKENLRPWYEEILAQVKNFGPDVEVAPKKGYVSLRRKKQFALVQPSTKTRLDIGLNLKGMAPVGALEAAGSWNTMCTHRVRVSDDYPVSAELIAWIRAAYDQAG